MSLNVRRETSLRSVALAILTSLRPKQWIKNLLVFAAPLFAYKIDVDSVTLASGAMVAFCMASGGVYLVNDYFDQEKDRKHPVKKYRPLASGLLKPSVALSFALVLFAAGIALSLFVSPPFALILVEYLFLQMAYNLILKEIVILDVFGLAAGFVLRAAGGGLAVSVPLSPWFLFCVGASALYLGFQKRKAEMARMFRGTQGTRHVLMSYAASRTYLAQIEAVLMGCVLLSYTLWTVEGAESTAMMATVPFVCYGVFRFQYKAAADPSFAEAPEEVLLRDLPLLICMAGWVATCFLVLSMES